MAGCTCPDGRLFCCFLSPNPERFLPGFWNDRELDLSPELVVPCGQISGVTGVESPLFGPIYRSASRLNCAEQCVSKKSAGTPHLNRSQKRHFFGDSSGMSLGFEYFARRRFLSDRSGCFNLDSVGFARS